MAQSGDLFDNLVSHARDAHVVVVGGGIAGLMAAYECAKVGIRVTLFEAEQQVGGAITSAQIGGMAIDTGASSWRADSTAMRDLIEELGLTERVVTPVTDATWIADPSHGWAAPLPEATVLGIPANPWDESVRSIIGWGGTWRAYLDRIRPPMTIGVSRNLGALVRSRMGAAVRDRLVAPLTFGRFGISPEDVDVDVAAPGLNAALTRTGSLAGAVSDLLVDRPDGPAVASLHGGLGVLLTALTTKLRDLGAVIHTGIVIHDVARDAEGWTVDYEVLDEERDADDPEVVSELATVVVLACGADATEALLQDSVEFAGGRSAMDSPTREIVTLLVESSALDAAPRGAQVYSATPVNGASGLVHQTARWEWLAQQLGAGRHILSVAFDGDPASHATTSAADDEVVARASAAASALLGVPADDMAVVDWARDSYLLDLPSSARGQADDAVRARDLFPASDGLVVVGAWVAGSGLARVVADAVAEADRVRSGVLWGGAAAG